MPRYLLTDFFLSLIIFVYRIRTCKSKPSQMDTIYINSSDQRTRILTDLNGRENTPYRPVLRIHEDRMRYSILISHFIHRNQNLLRHILITFSRLCCRVQFAVYICWRILKIYAYRAVPQCLLSSTISRFPLNKGVRLISHIVVQLYLLPFMGSALKMNCRDKSNSKLTSLN